MQEKFELPHARWCNPAIIDKSGIGELKASGISEPTTVGGIIVARAVRPSFSTKIRPEPASAGGIMRGQEKYLGNANNR